MVASDAVAHVQASIASLAQEPLRDEQVPYVTRAVCEEMTRCLVSTARVTGALNILIAEKQTNSIAQIFRCLPTEPAVATAVTRGLIPADFDTATHAALNALLDHIRIGKSSIARCRIFDGPCHDLGAEELEKLCHLWRHICALGIAVMCCLEASCKPFWSTEKLLILDRLIELLSNARDGERPCLGPDGYPLIPHWAEQRRRTRQRVDQCARVRVRKETHKVMVADLSTEGLGLDRIFGLRVGSPISVQLADGREYEGIVTWTAGGRAGLQICK
jgi:hypothetical protein